MDSRSLFIAGVRLFGVWEMLRCIDYALECFDLKVGFYHSNLTTVGATYTHMLAYFVVSLFLLGEAPRIANFFYPRALPPPGPEPS